MTPRPNTSNYKGRATVEEIEHRLKLLPVYLAEGLSAKQVAARLKCSKEWVYEAVRRDPKLRLNRPNDPIRMCGPKGTINKVLEGQDPAFLAWIADNRPEGITVAEFLVSCAIDAFHDETSNNEESARAA